MTVRDYTWLHVASCCFKLDLFQIFSDVSRLQRLQHVTGSELEKSTSMAPKAGLPD